MSQESDDEQNPIPTKEDFAVAVCNALIAEFSELSEKNIKCNDSLSLLSFAINGLNIQLRMSYDGVYIETNLNGAEFLPVVLSRRLVVVVESTRLEYWKRETSYLWDHGYWQRRTGSYIYTPYRFRARYTELNMDNAVKGQPVNVFDKNKVEITNPEVVSIAQRLVKVLEELPANF